MKDLYRVALDEVDVYYRAGGSCHGKACFYPAVAYEMNQNGDIHIGCFPYTTKNLFKSAPPKLTKGPVVCAHATCQCLDKYSFVQGINRNTGLDVLRIYGKRIRANLGIQPI